MKMLETEEYIDLLIEIVREGHEVTLRVIGHSMEPFLIHERDFVLLSPIRNSLQKGDIALFKRENGQYILHRICKIRREGFYFVGDNQNICDIEGPIKREKIYAVVHKVNRQRVEIQEGDCIWQFFKREWLWNIRWRRYMKKLLSLICRSKIMFKKEMNDI